MSVVGFRAVLVLTFSCVLAGTGASHLGAQRTDRETPDTLVFRLRPLEVTATRTAREAFLTPAPVSVLQGGALEQRLPNTVGDLFRDLPGLEVTGVGVQQPRPIIRGLRGQRILLLQDGVRLNNTRRQQDFGEVPALVDVAGVERVEIVRGAASVLYGTDAIGGVVNVITRRPTEEGVHGRASYRYGSASELNKGAARIEGRQGRLDFGFGGTWRTASDSYDAPSGTFGEITLAGATPVKNTGIEDRGFDGQIRFHPAEGHELFVKGETYRADEAGFGLVEPEAYANGTPRIEITYPAQAFDKISAGYAGQDLENALADRFELTGYAQRNERSLVFDFFQGFGPQAPPGAGLSIVNTNFTDLGTVGFRAEAKKLTGRVLWTYGLDLFRDHSQNADTSRTVVSGFGPPQEEVTGTPSLPEATYRSVGGFVQGESGFGDLTLIGGIRAQHVRAETRSTPGLESQSPFTNTDGTVVASLNGIYQLTPGLGLVASIGRGFRAPNLIEWFFEGAIPEASAYQLANPDLAAETSLSTDLGVRYRNDRVAVEAFVFRNKIFDGIRTDATGETIDRLAVFRSVNIDELIYRGVELSAEAAVTSGLTLTGGYTHLSSEDVRTDSPTGETYSNRLTGAVRYSGPGDRFWVAYGVRHNGDQKDVDLGTNPLGAVLPAFTVHRASAGARLFGRGGYEQRLTLAVDNLTDELYAEFSNASFFRPEPGRNLTLALEAIF